MADNELSFEDLKLHPGQALQLEFEGNASPRSKSAMIGYRLGGALIVSTPIKQGAPISVKLKAKINVRLFVNQLNSACAIESTIIHLSVTPLLHLYLSIPTKILTAEVRKSTRVIASAMVTKAGNKRAISCVIDDLSTAGSE